jgi:putative transcriptional regulator
MSSAASNLVARVWNYCNLLRDDGYGDYDELCLTPAEALNPREVRALRLREGASQAAFARYLNVTTGLVSQLERGEKHPHGASLKLLALVAKRGPGAIA